MQGTETLKTGILSRFSTYARAHNVSGANAEPISEEDIESAAIIVRETLEILENKHFSANIQPAELASEVGQRVGLSAALNQLVFHFFSDNHLSQANIVLLRYVLALKNDGCSISTIKNYRSDISQFFASSGETALLKMVTKPKLQAFLAGQKAKGLAHSSIRRKLVSITQFGIWLEVERIVAAHTFKWLVEFSERFEENSSATTAAPLANKTNNTHEEVSNRLNNSNKSSNWRAFVFGNPVTAKSPLAVNSSITSKSTSPLRSQEKRFQVKQGLYDLRSKLQARSQQYILPYLNLMLSAILFLGMGYFGYLQMFGEVDQPLAYPTALTRPNRTLSFQGRLTDTNQNPIISASDMRFRLYDSGPSTTGGSLLWDSGTCAVTPDQDGIFAVGLGEDCGAEIGSEVFSENANVWLQVEVEGEVLDPRQSIKSVAYALNSETLQGFPPADTTTGATNNTVLVMNNSGEVLLGQSNPKLDATSGTFTIEAQTLTLQTGAGSNGNINLDPDGTGKINLLANVDTTGYIKAPGATLSATYAGGTALTLNAGPSATADIMRWQNSSSSTLGVIDENGNFGIGTSNPLIKLHISDSADPAMGIVDTTNGVSLFGAAQDTTASYGTSSNHTLYITTNSLVRITALNTGNIGIGSTSPARLLDVGGTGRFTGALDLDSDVELNSTLTDINGSVGTSGQVLSSTASGVDWIDLPAGAENYWRLNLGTISPYNDTLDLLVGSNATASAKFAVLNVNSGTPAASVSSGVSGNSMFMTADGTLSTSRRQSLTIGNSSTYNTTGNVFINSNGTGNVGIGTTSSASRLDVASTALNSDVQRWVASDGSRLGRFTETSGGHGWFEVDNSSGTAVALFRADGGASYISSGNVGIGTTAPGSLLDVAGYIKAPGATLSATYAGGTALTLNAGPTATADIMRWQNSAGTILGLVNNSGYLGIGTTSVSSDYLISADGSTATDISKMISLTQNNDTKETTYGIDYAATTSKGTLGLEEQVSDYGLRITSTPTVTLSGNDSIYRNYGTYYDADLSGITSLPTGNGGSASTYGMWNNIDGNPVFNNSAGSGGSISAAGMRNNVNVSPTLTSVPSGATFITIAGDFANSSNTTGHANLLAYAYGLQVQNSAALTTTGTTVKYGGHFSTSGSADTSYGIYVNTTGATANWGIYSAAGINYFADNVGIGTTTTSAFKLTTAGNIGPSANNTYDLGASGTRWANVYATAFTQNGNTVCDSSNNCGLSNYWRLANGALSPTNDTLDLFVGSNATASAKFAVLNVNNGTPTASVSSGVSGNSMFMTADGTLATQRRQSLTIGNSATYNTTGNVLINPNGVGNVGIGSTAPAYKLDVNGTGRFVGAVDFDGDIELNSTLTDVNGSVGTSGQVLTSTSTGVDWVDAATVGTDDQTLAEVLLAGNSAGATNIDMNDQLILNIGAAGTDFTSGGGLTLAGALVANSTITANAAFTANGAFTLGDNGDTGSINTSDWDISTTGAMTGISGITNDSTFTTSGGAVNINASSNFATNINTGSSSGAVTLGGGSNNVAINSSVWDITSAGVASGLTGLTSSGTITFSGLTANRLVTTTTGGQLTTTISSANAASSFSDETGSGLIVFSTSPEINTSITTGSSNFDLLNTTATTINFAGAASTLNIGPGSATTTSINLAGGSGATGCTVDGATGNFSCSGTISGSNTVWQYLNGAISPITPYTNNADLLVGGDATASAKFAVLNVMSGTPVASVSSGVSGNSMFMTADGSLSTTRRSSLTIGNSSTYNTTGDILINPNGTGNVGVGTTAPADQLHVFAPTGAGGAKGLVVESVNGIPTIKLVSDTDTKHAFLTFVDRDTSTSIGGLMIDRATPVTTGAAQNDIVLYTNSGTSNKLHLATENVARLTIDATGNVGIGSTAPNDLLDVAGAVDTSTFYKLGDSKILDMENTSSLLVGHEAGTTIAAGAEDNTLLGHFAGYDLTTGDSNTFVGSGAGADIIDGNNNTFIGLQAGNGTSTGDGYNNAALGDFALFVISSGGENAVLGSSSGGSITTGSGNALVGANADVTSGAFNYGSALGYDAGIGASYSIALGYKSLTTASNQLVIGNAAANAFINDVYIGEGVLSASPSDFTLNATGGSGTDIAGANMTLAGGKGTGNADGGDIIFSTADTGSTGTTLQTLTEKMRLTDEGNLGIGTSNPASFKLQIAGSVGPQTDSTYDLGSASLAWANIYGDNIIQNGNAVCDVSGNCANLGNYWRLNLGTISPVNDTLDLLVGSNASESAKFAVLNMNTGTPTASVSSGVSGNSMFMTADGTLSTTRRQSLTIGNSSTYNTTGDVFINSNGTGNVAIGTTSAAAKFLVYDATSPGIASVDSTNGVSSYLLSQDTYAATGTSTNHPFLITTNSASRMYFDTAGNIGVGTTTTSSFRLELAGSVGPTTNDTYDLGSDALRWRDLYLGGETIHLGTSTTDEGTISYDTATNVLGISTDSTTNGDIAFFIDDLFLDKSAGNVGINTTAPSEKLDVLGGIRLGAAGANNVLNTSAAAGVASGNLYWGDKVLCDSGGSCSALVNYWRLTDGAISPVNDTFDFLIGAESTASAKFAVLNVDTGSSGTPVASVSSGVSGTSMFMTADGTLATQNRMNLTIGNSSTFDTTGNVLINPNGTGNVAIGKTTAALKLHVDSDSGGALSEVAFFEGGFSADDESEIIVGAGLVGNDAAMFGFHYRAGTDDYGYTRVYGGSKALAWNASGSVGIGTTAPAQTLHVASAGTREAIPASAVFTDATDTTEGLFIGYNSTSNYGIIAASDLGTAWHNVVLQPTAGNVGIGNTAPGATLHISSTTSPSLIIDPGANTTVDPTISLYDTSTTAGFQIMYDNTDGATYFKSIYNNAAGDIHFQTKTAGTPVDAMTIESAGNVGIGTSNPLANLAVSGNTQILGSNTHVEPYTGYNAQNNISYVIRQPTSSAAATPIPTILFSNNQTGTSTNIGTLNFMNEAIVAAEKRVAQVLVQTDGATDDGLMILRTYNSGTSTDAVTIDNAGYVGIGSTDPTQLLDIVGTTAAGGVEINVDNTDSTGYSVLRMSEANLGNLYAFETSYGGSGAFSAGTAALYGSGAGGTSITAANAAGTIRFYTTGTGTGTERMRILANGNVGIGNTTGGQKLDVTGNIRASSQLISTVATGTAPLAVSSTTAVSNLNADMTDGYHVAETNTASTIAARTSSGDLNVRLIRQDYTTTNASVNYIMTQVAVGTTAGGADNYIRPSTPAQVRADMGLDAGGSADIWVEKAGDTMTGTLQLNSNVTFDGVLGLTYSGTTSRLAYSSGDVDGTDIRFADSDGTIHGYVFGDANGANFGLLDGDGSWMLQSIKDTEINFLVNNSEKMTIISNGNVGIGSTGPIHTLDIARAAAGEGAAIRLINTTATGYTALRFGDTTAAGSDSYIHNFNSTWTQSNYWIPSTMGIGAAGNGIVLAATDTVNGEIQMFTGTASTSPDFMLAANGNVGIADSTPTFKLDVNGTGRFVGNVTAPTFVGALSGNATTATALAANGGNCSSGQFPLGVNASGAVETCSTSLSGNASTATTLATARTIWGQSFNGSANITGALTVGDTNSASNGAIEGTNNISGGYGVWGTSNAGYGVYGYANGNGRGVNGQSTGTGGVGVRGVGVSGGGYDFLADGTGVDYGVGSSIRWKRDLAPLENALDKVLAMRGLYYTWDEAHGGFRDMGMIAEEVLLQVPEIVAIDPSAPGFASGMDYGKLTPVLVEAIKEQQRQIVSLSNNGTSQLTFTSEGELAINGSAGNYTVTPTGQSPLTTVIGASKAVVGKITAGLINTRELVVQQSATIASLSVNSLTVSGQNINTYIRNIVQQELQTTSLPPGSVAQDFSTDNLTVTEDASISGTLAVSDIQADSVTATTSTLGSLLADTASISGSLTVEQDASVAGTLIAGNITAESSRFQTLEARMAELENIKAQTAELVDATVSGTLYADSIYNFDEKIAESFKKPSLLELLTNSDPEAPEAASPASIYEPVEMAGYASVNPDLIATDSAILALDETDVVLGASAIFVEKYLEVNGHGYVAQSLGVGETLKIGNSLIFTNGSINYQPAGVENPVLAIQSSGQGKLDFLAGVMTIENGQVAITGDLHVAGRIKTDTLLTNLVQPADFGNPFQVQVAGASTESGEIKKSRFEIIDENGEAVATFDSEGNASFQGGISVANQNLAEEEPDDDTVTTEKSSGQAKLRSGKEELKIQTPKATPDSLIYVTPKGSTDNKVLYIKGQGDGEFTVGFDDAIGNDVEFNWWIVN